jgi:hydrogenase-4 component F
MTGLENLIWVLLAVPALAGALCLALGSAKKILAVVAGAGVAWAALVFITAWAALDRGSLAVAGQWLRLDALSAYHAIVLALVSGAGSAYSWGYFGSEISSGKLRLSEARKFGVCWFGAAGAMVFVLLCDNLGLMWVGIEATTLVTAFLICVHVTDLSLEASWKYLLVCCVGVAFAFVGTLLVGAASRGFGLGHDPGTLLWTRLQGSAALLDPKTMKLAFIFLLVGYGTKAGLVPMHSWLPDAHSQAPAPVSALFSGFMLNAALYCVMRCLSLVEGVPGAAGWGRGLLEFLGIASILVAAAFIVFQRDGKRLLAYSSIEHMGIIALGLGLGGLGTFAALWHVLNHSVAKALAFFSMGRLGQAYGTHDLEKLAGAMRRSPVWGAGFTGGLLALIGAAPFAVFMSEFLVLRAAAQARQYLVLVLFLAGVVTVFVGALRHVITPAWGKPALEPKPGKTGAAGAVLVFAALGLLLLLGLWMPAPLRETLGAAAKVLGGNP